MKKVYLLLIMICFAGFSGFAQPGVLDQSFGVVGKVSIPTPYLYANVVDIKLQPDGKSVVLVQGDSGNFIGNRYILERHLSNGALDTSFGTNGRVFPNYYDSIFGILYRVPSTIEILANGKILVSTGRPFGLSQYNSNGTPDLSFGNKGTINAGLSGEPTSMLVLPNGKIMQAGWGAGLVVIRYNSNGSIDNSYGVNGMALKSALFNTRVNADEEDPVSFVLLPNGKAIGAANSGLTRFNANGSIDSTFGINGTSTVTTTNLNNNYVAAAVQPNGKMIFLSKNIRPNLPVMLHRFNVDGSYDNTFDSTAIDSSIFSPTDYIVQANLFVLPNGKILLACYSGATLSKFLMRFNSDGTKDLTFGRRGAVRGILYYGAAAIQADGKIITGGDRQYCCGTRNNAALARYESGQLYYNYLGINSFLDRNFNGIKDVNEDFTVGLSASIMKGNNNISATSSYGYFESYVDTGNYLTTVSPTYPYYNVVPASRSTNHATYFNEDTLLFALQAIPGHKDVSLTIVPLYTQRPGFFTGDKIVISNNGTDTISSTYFFKKDSRLLYRSVDTTILSVSGDTLTLSYSKLPPLKTTSVTIGMQVMNSPVVQIGDTLRCSAIAPIFPGEAVTADNTASIVQIVSGAYDPNDKTESHAGKITKTKISSGEYLTYTIRFQNTGNDTAFNIYIRDTLDIKLDWNTMQTLAASHNYQMTMNDGKCLFTFPDIKLVDSNKNEAKSHGYIVYRIKAKPTIQIGNVIKNSAAIYFDYNLPIFTNTEKTTVVADVLPLKLLSFNAKKENKTNLLNWSTTQELNLDRFEVERSTNPNSSPGTGGREFSKIGTIKAGQTQYSFTDEKPAMGKTNYYRLKMLDKDGQFSYSPIRMINNNGSFYVNIYPNPAKEVLQVQIESDKSCPVQILVLSADGKVLLSNSITAVEGGSLQSINISTFPKGSYFLKVISSNEEQMVKFEKL